METRFRMQTYSLGLHASDHSGSSSSMKIGQRRVAEQVARSLRESRAVMLDDDIIREKGRSRGRKSRDYVSCGQSMRGWLLRPRKPASAASEGDGLCARTPANLPTLMATPA